MRVSRNNQQLTSDLQNNDYGFMGLGLIHDLAGPITSALIDIERLNAEIQNIYKNIKQAQERILINSRTKRFNLHKQLVQIIDEIQMIESKVPIIIKNNGNLWIIGDDLKFNLAIRNLVNNAVESYSDDLIRRPIAVSYKIINSNLQITIRDYGRGVDTLQARTNSHHMGLGLGLARRIIEQEFEGQIRFRKVIGKGSKCEVLVGRTCLNYN